MNLVISVVQVLGSLSLLLFTYCLGHQEGLFCSRVVGKVTMYTIPTDPIKLVSVGWSSCQEKRCESGQPLGGITPSRGDECVTDSRPAHAKVLRPSSCIADPGADCSPPIATSRIDIDI